MDCLQRSMTHASWHVDGKLRVLLWGVMQRLGSQGAGGMAAVARADSVGSEKSSVVDAGAKREEMDGAAIVKPTATAAHAPAMRTAADILASLSSP